MNRDNIDIVIKNLSDGGLYTANEISLLTKRDIEYVEKILNDKTLLKTCGDGSGVIYYMDIKYDTIVDGTGFRNTVYCAGCNICCKGCHNPQSWSIENGKPITVNKLSYLLLENGSDITFSGGECSLQAKTFTILARILKSYGRNIWLYSGHTYNELFQDHIIRNLLDIVDVIVDGKFIEEQKNINLLFRGSANQRVIDMNKTKEKRKIILLDL